ncbi:MAG: Zn-ribbon domain-containing OB-fold protein [Syntrophales bacterium]|jgi:hypothetical protein|nr:Zn-ribbon domain-containing OB-fold protein [Syntrophales bacterium]
MEKPKKPSPVVNPVARPFWDAAWEDQLVLQKCTDCDRFIFYPRLFCPHCHSDNLTWERASGKGTVYSYTVVLNNPPSPFLDDVPYVVAIIRLEEGVQMLSNIVGCKPEEVRCDMPVEVIFEQRGGDFKLPMFQPMAK